MAFVIEKSLFRYEWHAKVSAPPKSRPNLKLECLLNQSAVSRISQRNKAYQLEHCYCGNGPNLKLKRRTSPRSSRGREDSGFVVFAAQM